MILDLPETPSGIARVSFEIERVDYAAPEASGRQGGVQAGWPLWSAAFEIERSDPDSADQWRAFFARLRGRIRRFYAGDILRRFPAGFPAGFAGLVRAGGGAFDGSATSWDQAITADGDAQITVTGLPANFPIALGDYIGFKWDAAGAPLNSYERRTMARAVLPAVASGLGTAVVTVEPPVNTLVVPPAAVAHFDNPLCVMQLIPENSSLGPIGHGRALGGGAIAAIQDLRA